MKNVSFPYGKEQITYDFEKENFGGVLVSKLHEYKPEKTGIDLIRSAMENPIGSKKLSELARDKKNDAESELTTNQFNRIFHRIISKIKKLFK